MVVLDCGSGATGELDAKALGTSETRGGFWVPWSSPEVLRPWLWCFKCSLGSLHLATSPPHCDEDSHVRRTGRVRLLPFADAKGSKQFPQQNSCQLRITSCIMPFTTSRPIGVCRLEFLAYSRETSPTSWTDERHHFSPRMQIQVSYSC